MSSWSSWGPGSGMSMFAAAEDPWGMQPPPVWRMGEDGQPRPVDTEGPVKKKTPKRKGHDQEEEEEDEDSDERGSSRANASFNAWFPIMLGMYPGQGTAEGDDSGARGRPRPSPEGEGVAAIANSVNHGRSGVASSHAIIYSGEPPVNYANRRRSQPQQPYNQQQPFEVEQRFNQQQPAYNQQPQQQRYHQPQQYYR